MLLIDDRESDRELLLPILTRLGLNADVTRLEFGDACFLGNGIDSHGSPCEVTVGIERKRLDNASEDLLSSMTDRRLSGHQLRGLTQCYDHCFLLIEGMWRCGSSGALEVYRNKADGWQPLYRRGRGDAVSWRALMSYLTTLELRSLEQFGRAVHIRYASTREQTAAHYAQLYYWFTEKQWKEHSSCDQVYAKGREQYRDLPGGASNLVPNGALRQPHFARLVAMQLPRIDSRERWVLKHFKTAREMANADVSEWVNLKWVDKKGKERRLGPTTGAGIYQAWNSTVEGL